MTNSVHKHQPSHVYASKIRKSGLKVTKRYLQDVKRCAIIVKGCSKVYRKYNQKNNHLIKFDNIKSKIPIQIKDV